MKQHDIRRDYPVDRSATRRLESRAISLPPSQIPRVRGSKSTDLVAIAAKTNVTKKRISLPDAPSMLSWDEVNRLSRLRSPDTPSKYFFPVLFDAVAPRALEVGQRSTIQGTQAIEGFDTSSSRRARSVYNSERIPRCVRHVSPTRH